MPDNVAECRERLLSIVKLWLPITKEHEAIVKKNIVCHDALTYDYKFEWINMEKETFWTLFFDIAHWEFEIFLMVLFDFVLGFVGWRYILQPILKKWFSHHKDDHTKLDELEDRIKKLEDAHVDAGILSWMV